MSSTVEQCEWKQASDKEREYFLVFSGHFEGKFWESRISDQGVFVPWKFRAGDEPDATLQANSPLRLQNMLRFRRWPT